MNLTIQIGWWLLPTLLTISAFIWAWWPREDEKPTGGMFSGMGAALGLLMRTPTAAAASLLAWLAWSLLT